AQIAVRAHLDRDSGAGEPLEREHVAHQLAEIDRLDDDGELAEALVGSDEPLQPVGLLDDQIEELALPVDRSLRRALSLQELRGALERGERVPEIVRELRREAPQA